MTTCRVERRAACNPTVVRAVPFAACYVYSPSGKCAASERSRLLRAMLKAGDARFMFKYAVRVRQQAADLPLLSGFFDPATVLIPVPGSAPHGRGFVSVTEHLAAALVGEGLGRTALPVLHRMSAVHKSATAAPGRRPTVATHYASLAVERTADAPRQIVLIDDVVTKGRTLLAAATRVHEAFPGAQIRAFALIRTMGMVAEVDRLLAPCVGEIRWRAGDAHRSP